MRVKRFLAVIASMVIFATVAACANKSSSPKMAPTMINEAADDQATTEVAAAEPETTAEAKPPNNPATDERSNAPKEDAPSVVAICQGYLENDPEMEPYYTILEDGWITMSDSDYLYCPEAVYRGDWKDFQAVAQSYFDQSQPWRTLEGTQQEFIAESEAVIWTKGYKHLLEVMDDWLYLDGFQVYPLGRTAHSMDPDKLIQAYQNGDWNDQECLYSDDYCSSACIDSQGRIRYCYDSKGGYDEVNYETLYGDMHLEDIIDELIDAKLAKRYAYTPKTDGPAFADYDAILSYAQLMKETLSAAEYVRTPSDGVSKKFVDLPLSHPGSNIVWSKKYHYQEGTFFLVEDGIELWLKGKKLQTWNFPVDHALFNADGQVWRNYQVDYPEFRAFFPQLTYSGMVNGVKSPGRFVLTLDTLYQLKSNGKVRLVADGVQYAFFDEFYSVGFILSINGSTLEFARYRHGKKWTFEQLSQDLQAGMEVDDEFYFVDTSGKGWMIADLKAFANSTDNDVEIIALDPDKTDKYLREADGDREIKRNLKKLFSLCKKEE